ncbi:MAG: hypothetical protein KatS3mg008_0518 [Acidimicrobiales bacterium]|nr:MAG: hypothetical protein KatS3mg008_0518 [Acidimicrobiales bacterium]
MGGVESSEPYRIVIAKVGLDGHDRGIKVVTRQLRDNGFEVIYLGLRQTPETIAATALQEDADAVGISIHTGSHMTLAPAVVQALREAGHPVPVILGGIIPDRDVPRLLEMGIAAVLTPGATEPEVVSTVRSAILGHSDRARSGYSGPTGGDSPTEGEFPTREDSRTDGASEARGPSQAGGPSEAAAN